MVIYQPYIDNHTYNGNTSKKSDLEQKKNYWNFSDISDISKIYH